LNERSKTVNKNRRAVALQYQPEKNPAPTVAASGRGWLADRIVALARENRVPIVEDATLVRMLESLSLGEEVPRELYEAIAAIYAFVLEADRRKANSLTPAVKL
jgi:flagellar biosynthesis protein